MAANQLKSLRIKKDDMVVITSGKHKGKSGKVLATHPREQAVTIEGIGLIKRHIKPNQLNPRGGTKEIHQPIAVSKVALTHTASSNKPTRVGYSFNKDGNKVRIAKSTSKEIK